MQVYQDQSLADSIRYKALQKLTFSMIFSDGAKVKPLIYDALKNIARQEGKSKLYYEFLQNLGIYYDVHQQTDSSFVIFSEIVAQSKKQGWKVLERRSYNNLGMNRLNSSYYRMAIEYFSAALDLAKQDPDSKPADYVNYISNLGLANQELELIDQAIIYHLEAYEIRKNLGNSDGMAISCANLGVCYKVLGKYKQAVSYYQKAIGYAKEVNNKLIFHRTYDNLGTLYLEQKDYLKALEMYNKALNTSEDFTLSPKLELSIVSNATVAYSDLGQEEKAFEFANRGLELLELYPELVNYSVTLNFALAKLFFRKGNFVKGSAYLEEYKEVSKQVFQTGNARLLTDLQVKYDLEKKENRIALQEAEIQEKSAVLQRNYLAFVALGLLILLLCLALVFFQNRHKRKREILEKDVKLQLKEAYIKASLESQERERRRMAQDLHDGFGQFISALRLYMNQIKNKQAEEEVKVGLVNRADTVLDEMSKEISNVVYNLMPSTLIRFGLVSALEDMAQRINAGQEVNILIEPVNMEERLEESIEINLFRICQEWINNILKYSGATQVTVVISQSHGTGQLKIWDDGSGFDRSVLQKSIGNGWENIRTRTELLHGNLELNTVSGKSGSELVVIFPFVHTFNAVMMP